MHSSFVNTKPRIRNLSFFQTNPMRSGILFLLGGGLYVVLELFWRGRSHISMFFAGGTALMLIGGLYRWFAQWPVFWLCAAGTLIITAVEFLAGAVVNVRLGLSVWDYSRLPCNLYGQICLRYSLAWFLLSVPAIGIAGFVYSI